MFGIIGAAAGLAHWEALLMNATSSVALSTLVGMGVLFAGNSIFD